MRGRIAWRGSMTTLALRMRVTTGGTSTGRIRWGRTLQMRSAPLSNMLQMRSAPLLLLAAGFVRSPPPHPSRLGSSRSHINFFSRMSISCAARPPSFCLP